MWIYVDFLFLSLSTLLNMITGSITRERREKNRTKNLINNILLCVFPDMNSFFLVAVCCFSSPKWFKPLFCTSKSILNCIVHHACKHTSISAHIYNVFSHTWYLFHLKLFYMNRKQPNTHKRTRQKSKTRPKTDKTATEVEKIREKQ